MRYYRIEIDGGSTVFTTYDGTRTLPGALMVNLDIPVAPFAQPMGSAYVKIWGIARSMISQAKDFNNKTIKIFGGFQKGLPLANPAQAGLLVQGYIFQAFGNWILTEQSLDFMIVPGSPPASASAPPPNIVLNWKKGTQLGDAIKSTLSTAYPSLTVKPPSLNAGLIAAEDQIGIFSDLQSFSKYVQAASAKLINKPTYTGVNLYIDGTSFTAYDGTSTPAVKSISFKDLIGQPTWIQSPSIQWKCPMRADIKIGDIVKLPPVQITNTTAAQTSLVNQQASFQGNFQVSSIHHVGSSRQATAESWASIFEAFPQQTQASTP